MTGRIELILLAAAGGEELNAHASARLLAGHGLEGDRYAEETGTFSKKLRGEPEKELTLIESEEIAAFNARTGHSYGAGKFRRNIVTSGIRLNELVGMEFRIGDLRLKGIRLCEPCSYLAKLLGQEVVKEMTHRCGLRAQILDSGSIAAGDRITPASSR